MSKGNKTDTDTPDVSTGTTERDWILDCVGGIRGCLNRIAKAAKGSEPLSEGACLRIRAEMLDAADDWQKLDIAVNRLAEV